MSLRRRTLLKVIVLGDSGFDTDTISFARFDLWVSNLGLGVEIDVRDDVDYFIFFRVGKTSLMNQYPFLTCFSG